MGTQISEESMPLFVKSGESKQEFSVHITFPACENLKPRFNSRVSNSPSHVPVTGRFMMFFPFVELAWAAHDAWGPRASSLTSMDRFSVLLSWALLQEEAIRQHVAADFLIQIKPQFQRAELSFHANWALYSPQKLFFLKINIIIADPMNYIFRLSVNSNSVH